MIIASLAEWKILEIPDGSYCIYEPMDDRSRVYRENRMTALGSFILPFFT